MFYFASSSLFFLFSHVLLLLYNFPHPFHSLFHLSSSFRDLYFILFHALISDHLIFFHFESFFYSSFIFFPWSFLHTLPLTDPLNFFHYSIFFLLICYLLSMIFSSYSSTHWPFDFLLFFHLLFTHLSSYFHDLLHTPPCTDYLIFFHFSILRFIYVYLSFTPYFICTFYLFPHSYISLFPAFLWRPEFRLCSGGGGRVWARSQTLRRKESLVL